MHLPAQEELPPLRWDQCSQKPLGLGRIYEEQERHHNSSIDQMLFLREISSYEKCQLKIKHRNCAFLS